MAQCYSEDDRILFPWVMRDVEKFWNEWFSQKFTFRSYTDGKSGSKSKAAYRFSRILRDGAPWLDGSHKTSIDVLYEVWETKMIGVSVYFEQNGFAEAESLINQPVNARLTFWNFHSAGCRHIHHLSCLQLGIDPDGSIKRDLDRRKRKAEIISEFKEITHDFLKEAVVISGSDRHSNARLEQALHIAKQALAQAIDDLRWESDK